MVWLGARRAGDELVELIGGQAEGQSGRGFQLDAGDVGADVAGVGGGEGAVREEVDAAGGGEAHLGLAEESVVEVGEDGGGVAGGFAAEDAEDHGDAHGGGEAFAGDVADDGEEGAVFVGREEEEVAADLAGGVEGGFNVEAGSRTGGAGEEELLDVLGGCYLGGEGGAAACDANGAEDEEAEQGEEEEEMGDLVPAEVEDHAGGRRQERQLAEVHFVEQAKTDLDVQEEPLYEQRNGEQEGVLVTPAKAYPQRENGKTENQRSDEDGDDDDQREENRLGNGGDIEGEDIERCAESHKDAEGPFIRDDPAGAREAENHAGKLYACNRGDEGKYVAWKGGPTRIRYQIDTLIYSNGVHEECPA